MVSESLFNLADRMSAYALHGRAIEPEHAACIATELLECARTVAVMETLPFDVTMAIASAIEVPTP